MADDGIVDQTVVDRAVPNVSSLVARPAVACPSFEFKLLALCSKVVGHVGCLLVFT